MAKKKQLAGKKTKLAELSLTRALTGQEPETAWRRAAPSAAASPAPASLGERAAGAAASPLAATYLYLVQELTDLYWLLHSSGSHENPPRDSLPAWRPADPLLMELALWRTRQGLRDLQSLLSHS